VILFSIIFACSKKNYEIKNMDESKQLPKTVVFEEITDKVVNTIDRDGNGKVDIWNFQSSEGGPIVIKALDLNQDGKEDLRTYFDNNGNITKEEIDGDFDGVVDMIDYYTNNNRTESQIDTNTDRIFDVFRFYENGKLVREAIDFNYDQTIDSTFTYDAEGNKKREETP
jgi:antitoxin component YwqK of YwqJK toxin-antitoxin module